MATRIETLLIDDLDGSQAEETVRFSLDGADYEIDLTEAHAAELRGDIGRFASKGRIVRPEAPRRRSSAPALGRQRTQIIRAWAQAQGMTVNHRGRLNASVVNAYEKAHTN